MKTIVTLPCNCGTCGNTLEVSLDPAPDEDDQDPVVVDLLNKNKRGHSHRIYGVSLNNNQVTVLYEALGRYLKSKKALKPINPGAGIVDGAPVSETPSQYAVRAGGADPPEPWHGLERPEALTTVFVDSNGTQEYLSDPGLGRCPIDGGELVEEEQVNITTPWGPRMVRYFICNNNSHVLYVEDAEYTPDDDETPTYFDDDEVPF